MSSATKQPGHVEKIPKGAGGYGRYKFRVIGRDGFPKHHTNSRNDAEWYLGKCREFWKENPNQK